MASSSTPSSSSHFISKSWNHEVFLSFRGEDTRKTFVDHLYTSLVQQGIQTYKDDETLPLGEFVGPSLQKAIRESRIAVVVFSEKFADSSWCLDELAYIMKCMTTRGQIVMPVFYDVDPSDVRKQKGKYGEAFTKHESDQNNNKVESWRKALAAAGNLSGWVPKDFANGIQALVVSNESYPPCLPQVLANMKNARWISLENYPKSSLPANFKPTKLGCLTLRDGLQEELWLGIKGNAVENHFMSLICGSGLPHMPHQPTFTLQLPHNWYNDFSGFLLCTDTVLWIPFLIVIKQEETCLDVQPDHWPEFDKNPESGEYSSVGYVSFGSLRHTSWWNTAYSKLSFELGDMINLKVGLVPRKSNGDSNERAKGAVDSSEFWDEDEGGDNKTFKIVQDSKSSVMIQWRHY